MLTFFATIAQGIWVNFLNDEGILVVDLPLVLLFIFGRKKLRLSPSSIALVSFAVLFMVWSHIGYSFAPNRIYFLQETVMNIRTFLIFIAIVSFVNTKEEMQNVFLGLTIGALFQGLIGVHQWLRGPVGLGFWGEQRFLSWQAMGTFVHASVFGMYISLMTILNYRMAAFLRPKYHKLYIAAFFIGITALYASLNRATWLAFASSMVLMFIVDTIRGKTFQKRTRKFLVALGIVALAGTVRYGPIIIDRFSDAEETLTDERSSSRKSLALDALRIINDHPVFGVGLNNYREFVNKETAGTKVVHCSYLLIAAELGWTGLVIFSGLLISAGILGIKLMRSKDVYINNVAAALVTALMSFSIAILPSPDYRILYVKTHIWMIFALLVVLAKLEFHLSQKRTNPGEKFNQKTKTSGLKEKKKYKNTGPFVPNIGPRDIYCME
jgi:hypothetical protein